jgi:hypothetical protein
MNGHTSQNRAARGRHLPFLGVTLMTPALLSGGAFAKSTPPAFDGVIDTKAITCMQAMLELSPADKLCLAGDRILLEDLSYATPTKRTVASTIVPATARGTTKR